jgi:ribosome modulation factor
MDVNGIGATSANMQNQNSQGANGNSKVHQNQNSQGANNNNNANNNPGVIVDTYEPSVQETYTPDMNRVKMMWAEHDQQMESFRRLIETLLNKQGETAGAAEGWRSFSNPFSGEMVEIDAETRAAAQEAIGEGGYYSVEETAKRILNFAVALSGGDPAKADLLERAAMRGFAAAENIWGREMPEITRQTMAAVQEGFNQWREAGSASAITLLNG